MDSQQRKQLIRDIKDSERKCIGCGKSLKGTSANRKWCSQRCRHLYHEDANKCTVCGVRVSSQRDSTQVKPIICRECLKKPWKTHTVRLPSNGRKRGAGGWIEL